MVDQLLPQQLSVLKAPASLDQVDSLPPLSFQLAQPRSLLAQPPSPTARLTSAQAMLLPRL
jgi:hypothetical protein